MRFRRRPKPFDWLGSTLILASAADLEEGESVLEEALEVFEVFASGTLADEVYVLDDVAGKRIAIAPAALKAKYRKE